MQVYRGLPILTNQSSQPARLVAIWPLDHESSVESARLLAHAVIDEILAAGRTAVVVGGTGLYLRAALSDLALPPAPMPGDRDRWSRFYDDEGADAAHAHLAELDPAAARVVHANDRRRVVRALELAEAGSSLAPDKDRLWAGGLRHPTVLVGLDVPKVEARATHRDANAGDVLGRRRGRSAPRARRADVDDGAEDAGHRGDRGSSSRRGDRRDRHAHAPLRGVPAQVDAAARRGRYGRCRPPAGRRRR